MSYDFYKNFRIVNKEDVDNLTRGLDNYEQVRDVLLRILLLNTVYGTDGRKFPDRRGRLEKIEPDVYAKVGEGDSPMGLKALIHSNGNYNDYLQFKLSKLYHLGINAPIKLSSLPKGSWVIEFPITLATPFMSKDDIPFYIIENPVRKDKVFGVPFISAMAWKGNLRWTMMKVFLDANANNPNKFAQIRLRHTYLFGSEKGWGETKGWSKWLDDLCPDAKERYRELLKRKFNGNEPENVHIQGMLYFYHTFWDRIDMMVINPHDRRKKVGKKPIYFEIVPSGAKGFFRLVYVPFYWIAHPEEKLKEKVIEDLKDVVDGIREMMLTYGFSAKKSSGFGIIENKWDKSQSKIKVTEFFEVQRFGNFEELKKIIQSLKG